MARGEFSETSENLANLARLFTEIQEKNVHIKLNFKVSDTKKGTKNQYQLNFRVLILNKW